MCNRISMDRNEENQVKTLKNREVELKIQPVLLFCNSKATKFSQTGGTNS